MRVRPTCFILLLYGPCFILPPYLWFIARTLFLINNGSNLIGCIRSSGISSAALDYSFSFWFCCHSFIASSHSDSLSLHPIHPHCHHVSSLFSLSHPPSFLTLHHLHLPPSPLPHFSHLSLHHLHDSLSPLQYDTALHFFVARGTEIQQRL